MTISSHTAENKINASILDEITAQVHAQETHVTTEEARIEIS